MTAWRSSTRRYRDRGFAVLGFPANEFGEQEPGSNEEIQSFCRSVYGVDFPMFAKIVVKGDGQHPLYRHLIAAEPRAEFPAGNRPANADDSAIHWNFEKFLIDRNGKIAARFAPDMVPENPRVVAAIEAELARRAERRDTRPGQRASRGEVDRSRGEINLAPGNVC